MFSNRNLDGGAVFQPLFPVVWALSSHNSFGSLAVLCWYTRTVLALSSFS